MNRAEGEEEGVIGRVEERVEMERKSNRETE